MELPKGFLEENFKKQFTILKLYFLFWYSLTTRQRFFSDKKMALINPLHASYKALKRRAAKLKM